MSQTIQCPHCNQPVEITQALRHQIQHQVLAAEQKKHQQALEAVQKTFEQNLKDKQAEFRQAFDDRVEKIQQQAVKKTQEQFELQLKNAAAEAKEQAERNQQLQEQLLETSKLIRELKQKDEQRQLEMEKKLAEEEDQIRQTARKQVEEEQHLKVLAKDKQLQDALKANEDLRRKLEQGSQQTQGEVLELELEELLASQFPLDVIKPVPKGIRGADVIQEVRNQLGKLCGTLLWESKNTKNWTEGWVSKLKQDQRQLKAEIAILITKTLPENITNFAFRDGIWVTNQASLIGLATALRLNLVQLHQLKQASVGKNEKMEVLYHYLSGNEFRQRIEGIVEAYNALQDELEREKRWFTTKWAKQEKQIRSVVDQVHGMHGDLQGIIGASLPTISSLELPEEVGE
jgi:hypothetical protein